MLTPSLRRRILIHEVERIFQQQHARITEQLQQSVARVTQARHDAKQVPESAHYVLTSRQGTVRAEYDYDEQPFALTSYAQKARDIGNGK